MLTKPPLELLFQLSVPAQVVQAAVTLYYFKKKSKRVQIHRIQPDKAIQSEMFAVGSSAMMIQQTMLYKMAFKYGGDENGILMADEIGKLGKRSRKII